MWVATRFGFSRWLGVPALCHSGLQRSQVLRAWGGLADAFSPMVAYR